MFTLQDDEEVKSYHKPWTAPKNASSHCQHGNCERVAYRVLVVQSPDAERTVSLCGLHFLDACRSFSRVSSVVLAGQKSFDASSAIPDLIHHVRAI
ncbi:MAG: hypothetical protein LAO20_20540 [Acidobacteriia bacterium]|nr:hypothetical protein [Terriglobia bacterium]